MECGRLASLGSQARWLATPEPKRTHSALPPGKVSVRSYLGPRIALSDKGLQSSTLQCLPGADRDALEGGAPLLRRCAGDGGCDASCGTASDLNRIHDQYKYVITLLGLDDGGVTFNLS